MFTPKKVWLNGKIRRFNSVKLFPFFQALNYGASVFEGIRFYPTPSGRAVFRLDDHLDRLFHSAAVLRMNIQPTKEELHEAVIQLLRITKEESGYIRILAFYDEFKAGINIFNSSASVLIFSLPRQSYPAKKSVRVLISKYQRISRKAVEIDAKVSGYYANNLLGFIEAHEAGCDEAIFLDEKGYLTEGTVNNIFVVRGSELVTPMKKNILPGLTRESIMAMAPDIGLKVAAKNIAPHDLAKADEVFLTGTGVELERVKEIVGIFNSRNKHKKTDLLQNYYTKVTHGRVPKYSGWLTPVT